MFGATVVQTLLFCRYTTVAVNMVPYYTRDHVFIIVLSVNKFSSNYFLNETTAAIWTKFDR